MFFLYAVVSSAGAEILDKTADVVVSCVSWIEQAVTRTSAQDVTVSSVTSLDSAGESSTRLKTVAVSSATDVATTYSKGKAFAITVSATSSVAATGVTDVASQKTGTATLSSASSLDVAGGKSYTVSATMTSEGFVGINVLAEVKTENTVISDTFNRTDLGSEYTVITNPYGTTVHSVGAINGQSYVAGSSTVSACAYVSSGYDADHQWIDVDYEFWTTELDLRIFLHAQDGSVTNYIKAYGFRVYGNTGAQRYEILPYNYTGTGSLLAWHTYQDHDIADNPIVNGSGTLRLERVGGWVKYIVNGTLKLAAPLHRPNNMEILTGGQPAIYASKHTVGRSYFPQMGLVSAGDFTVTKYEDRRVFRRGYSWMYTQEGGGYANPNLLLKSVITPTVNKTTARSVTASMTGATSVTATGVKDALGALTSIQLNDNEATVALTDGAELDLTTSPETV